MVSKRDYGASLTNARRKELIGDKSMVEVPEAEGEALYESVRKGEGLSHQFVFEHDDGNPVLIRCKCVGMTNHELRDVITGLFFALSKEDQKEQVAELFMVEKGMSQMNPASRAIAQVLRDAMPAEQAAQAETEKTRGQ
jgi:hypothetical protein